MIVDPVTIRPEQKIADALQVMARYKISGVPVTDDDGKLVGILTNRDLRFETRLERSVYELMTRDNLITVPPGTTLDQAKALLHKHRIEKLLEELPTSQNVISHGVISATHLELARLYLSPRNPNRDIVQAASALEKHLKMNPEGVARSDAENLLATLNEIDEQKAKIANLQ